MQAALHISRVDPRPGRFFAESFPESPEFAQYLTVCFAEIGAPFDMARIIVDMMRVICDLRNPVVVDSSDVERLGVSVQGEDSDRLLEYFRGISGDELQQAVFALKVELRFRHLVLSGGNDIGEDQLDKLTRLFEVGCAMITGCSFNPY